MMATGRSPKIEGLGLQEVGVKLGERTTILIGAASAVFLAGLFCTSTVQSYFSQGALKVKAVHLSASLPCNQTGCPALPVICNALQHGQELWKTEWLAGGDFDMLCLAYAGKKNEVLVDEYSQTSVPSIWAVGDVTDRINLTPVALMEGMALAKTIALDQPTKPDYFAVPSAVFSNPNIATVVRMPTA
jgi:hypothetical protein